MLNLIKKTIKSIYFQYVHLLGKLPFKSEFLGPPKGFYITTCDWLLDFSDSSKKLQANLINIYPKSSIHRNPPKTIESEIHWKFEIEYSHEYPETFITLIPEGRVWGHNGTIITPDDKFLADLSVEIATNVSDHSILKQWKLPSIEYIDGTVAVLSAAGGNAYFHWMFDVLPRLHLLNQSGIDIDFIDKFLVNSLRYKFQKETLKILGIPENKILESCKYPHIKAKRLVVPSLPGYTGNIPQWACDFLKKELLVNDAIEKTEKIYISRGKASHRRVINEIELIDCLQDLDFKILNLEDLSITEQASLFSSAAMIVAPHGAGLSNLIFCTVGTKILELFSPNYVNVCFWAIANNMKLDYYYFIGEGKRPEKYQDPHLMGEDILIDVKSLANLIKNWN
ncbi:MAG: glycosyltransferase family 61 protein [Desmonostoc vinosum HA7617-LM4]|jgi:capsular polysaccharide biosynthesis protein|nr:glycosyltransferase family 61 protein [Desmonostoc vinosum HA7617-LM4]